MPVPQFLDGPRTRRSFVLRVSTFCRMFQIQMRSSYNVILGPVLPPPASCGRAGHNLRRRKGGQVKAGGCKDVGRREYADEMVRPGARISS